MRLIRCLACAALLAAATLPAQQSPARRLARDVFQQLIEINTTDSIGSTTIAAEAMRQRLLDAGFPPADLQIIGPNDRKGNLVARYRGQPGSTRRPVLLIGHLDVVEAKREDWTTDPFKFVEKDDFFYGRGTQDMKNSAAAMVLAFMRMKQEKFVPDRDLILALTADEEGGKSNGVDWLLKNHRDLVDAKFALNPDAGGLTTEAGKPVMLGVEATEKLYADFHLTVTNPGGHSSLPPKDNAIYQLASALLKIQAAPFPFELNQVTRAEVAKMSGIVKRQDAVDMKAILQTPPDPSAIARLSANPEYNSILRTTCVATILSAGHAPNALPGRAEANVNCRILPGHSQEEVRQDLIRIVADPAVKMEYVTDSGEVLAKGSDRKALAPPPLNPEVMQPLTATVAALWPGITILPEMEAGASDSIYTMAAGIPTYGFSGMGIDRGDDRAHGRDERLNVESYYAGVDFEYRYLKAMTQPQGTSPKP